MDLGMTTNIINMTMNKTMDVDNFPSLSRENMTTKPRIFNNMTVSSLELSQFPAKNNKIHACRFILEEKVCPRGASSCGFAHSIKELSVNDCMNAERCYLVSNKNSTYYNTNKDRKCNRKHPGESLNNFHSRVQTKKNMPTLPDEIPIYSSKCTKMCRNIFKGDKCEIPECPYAHVLSELVLTECGFRDKCIYVRKDKNEYVNVDAKNKVCVRKHPEETSENVVKRRLEEIEKQPILPVYPEDVTAVLKDGTFFIKTPYKVAMMALSIAMKNGMQNINMTTY